MSKSPSVSLADMNTRIAHLEKELRALPSGASADIRRARLEGQLKQRKHVRFQQIQKHNLEEETPKKAAPKKAAPKKKAPAKKFATKEDKEVIEAEKPDPTFAKEEDPV